MNTLYSHLPRFIEAWHEIKSSHKRTREKILALSSFKEVKPTKALKEPLNTPDAKALLGIPSSEGDPKLIIAAHKRVMLRNHPDRGGSPYLAIKINDAKELLLKESKSKGSTSTTSTTSETPSTEPVQEAAKPTNTTPSPVSSVPEPEPPEPESEPLIPKSHQVKPTGAEEEEEEEEPPPEETEAPPGHIKLPLILSWFMRPPPIPPPPKSPPVTTEEKLIEILAKYGPRDSKITDLDLEEDTFTKEEFELIAYGEDDPEAVERIVKAIENNEPYDIPNVRVYTSVKERLLLKAAERRQQQKEQQQEQQQQGRSQEE